MVKSRSSTHQFIYVVEDFNQTQRDVVEMGFGSLLNLKIALFPTRLPQWLLTNYNPKNSSLTLSDGSRQSVTEDDVAAVLGFHRGTAKIQRRKRVGTFPLYTKWKLLLRRDGVKITYGDLINVMNECRDGGDWFKQHFVVLVSSIFIDSPQNGYAGHSFYIIWTTYHRFIG
nr:hypothetical protein DM860_017426 [Ipomoea batatas]